MQFSAEGLRYAAGAGLVWVALHWIGRRFLAHRLIGGWPAATPQSSATPPSRSAISSITSSLGRPRVDMNAPA